MSLESSKCVKYILLLYSIYLKFCLTCINVFFLSVCNSELSSARPTASSIQHEINSTHICISNSSNQFHFRNREVTISGLSMSSTEEKNVTSPASVSVKCVNDQNNSESSINVIDYQ